jgi:hypothetical protein
MPCHVPETPQSRGEFATVSIGKELYLCGGSPVGPKSKVDKSNMLALWKLDTHTQQWAKLAPMPFEDTPVLCPALVDLQDGRILCIGGETHSLATYSIRANQWDVHDWTLPVDPCASLACVKYFPERRQYRLEEGNMLAVVCDGRLFAMVETHRGNTRRSELVTIRQLFSVAVSDIRPNNRCEWCEVWSERRDSAQPTKCVLQTAYAGSDATLWFCNEYEQFAFDLSVPLTAAPAAPLHLSYNAVRDEYEQVVSDGTHVPYTKYATRFFRFDTPMHLTVLPTNGEECGVSIWRDARRGLVFNTWVEYADVGGLSVRELEMPVNIPEIYFSSEKIQFVSVDRGIWCIGSASKSKTMLSVRVLDLSSTCQPQHQRQRQRHSAYASVYDTPHVQRIQNQLRQVDETDAACVPACGEVLVQFCPDSVWCVPYGHLAASSDYFETLRECSSEQNPPEPIRFPSEIIDAPVGEIILHLIFYGRLCVLPDEAYIQSKLIRACRFLLLQEDLCDIVHTHIGNHLSTRTICAVWDIAKEFRLPQLTHKCEQFVETLDRTTIAQIYTEHARCTTTHKRKRVM